MEVGMSASDLAKLFGNELKTAAGILAVVPAERIFEASSLDQIDVTDGVALSFRFLGSVPNIKQDRLPAAETVDAQVWSYGRPGSYTPLLAALSSVVAHLLALPYRSQGTARLWQIDFQGFGPDLYDPTFSANTKYASFRLVGSGFTL
jgi:hypothetical protein